LVRIKPTNASTLGGKEGPEIVTENIPL